jgi:uncharacterized repeat protein (TIGR03803 family)
MRRVAWTLFTAVLVFVLVCLGYAATERPIYTFASPGNGDGMFPNGVPVFDKQGNLYGTTIQGGTYNSGTVFELSRNQSGQWTETVLYNFTGTTDGTNPNAGLVFDTAGNLYGTAAYGGANGTGVIFKLSPQGPGAWIYEVLYNFGVYPQSGDGQGANSALIFDDLGNLYGTTYEGGASGCFQGCGTVFELSPNPDGTWTGRVLHAFVEDGMDGVLPTGIVLDGNGSLYGTTQNGGVAGSGVLYQLKYTPSRQNWVETILHQFIDGTGDGSFPESALLFRGGTLYGTTEGGGANSKGTVFKTKFSQHAGWVTKVLYSFGQPVSDGFLTQSALGMDTKGHLYGTTSYGGAYNYYGTVFKLSYANGTWIENTLYSFTGGLDGGSPGTGLSIRRDGVYGTTRLGGNNAGLVFQLH